MLRVDGEYILKSFVLFVLHRKSQPCIPHEKMVWLRDKNTLVLKRLDHWLLDVIFSVLRTEAIKRNTHTN